MSDLLPPAQGELPIAPEDRMLLRLDGFEGPLDLLLDLARGQKLDLAKISILSLVDQYLAVIEGARKIRLELAADWLVMAAWLTWLKSRLLLPKGHEAAEEGESAAEILAERLRTLQAMRLAAAWLGARPQLGHDIFARGLPEDLVDTDRSKLVLDIPGLLRAYLAAMARAALVIAAAAYDREESRGGHFRSDFPGPVPTLAHRSRLTVTELRTIVNAVLAGA